MNLNSIKMKRLILMIGLLLAGCSKPQDDTGKDCLQNCTVIQGHIVSLNDQPLKGIPIEFNNDKSLPYAPDIRKIAKTQTDENGYYEMSFYIEGDELGENAKGTFEINMDFSSLDTTKYLFAKNIKINKGIYRTDIPFINKRDTIIVKDSYMPQKTHVNISLIGYNPIEDKDFFRATVFLQSGLSDIDNKEVFFEYGPMAGVELKAINEKNEFTKVPVARGTNNMLWIWRRKSGQDTFEEIPFFMPEDSGPSIVVSY